MICVHSSAPERIFSIATMLQGMSFETGSPVGAGKSIALSHICRTTCRVWPSIPLPVTAHRHHPQYQGTRNSLWARVRRLAVPELVGQVPFRKRVRVVEMPIEIIPALPVPPQA